jgi:predicted RNA binding protein YcfA (HicA-like mRNA interferase family)
MSKRDKLIAKLRSCQHGFKWSELTSLLITLGYVQIQGDGSRVKFDNGNPDDLINLHKPHPNKEIKAYALRQVLTKLNGAGLI